MIQGILIQLDCHRMPSHAEFLKITMTFFWLCSIHSQPPHTTLQWFPLRIH